MPSFQLTLDLLSSSFLGFVLVLKSKENFFPICHLCSIYHFRYFYYSSHEPLNTFLPRMKSHNQSTLVLY